MVIMCINPPRLLYRECQTVENVYVFPMIGEALKGQKILPVAENGRNLHCRTIYAEVKQIFFQI